MKKGEDTGIKQVETATFPNPATQFQAGESGNPNGRPKKFITSLKAQGYKLSEINDCIKVMLSMTKKQLIAAQQNPQATMMELLIASAMVTDMKKGVLTSFETLVSRTYGKPKEHLEITTTPEVEAGKAYYNKLIADGVKPKRALKAVLTGARLNGVTISEDDILDADTIS